MALNAINFVDKATNLQLELGRPLTHKDLVSLMGFTPEEADWVDKFWDLTFNNDWIYLSDEIITEWMGYSFNKSTITNFNKKILTSKFQIETDYKEVKKDHPLIQSCPPTNVGKISDSNGKWGGSNRKYYIINGQTLKTCLMLANTEQGKKVRQYYIKVESLAALMSHYVLSEANKRVAVLEELAAQKDTTIAEQSKKIDELLKSNATLHEKLDDQAARMEKMLGFSEYTVEKLEETTDKLDVANEKLEETTDKLDIANEKIEESDKKIEVISTTLGVARQEVVVPHEKRQNKFIFCIYKHEEEHNKYKVFRCQIKSKSQSVRNCIDKGYKTCVFQIRSPNGINLWNHVRSSFPADMGRIRNNYQVELNSSITEQVFLDFVKSKDDEKLEYGS